MLEIQLQESWRSVLKPEFDSEYMQNLISFLAQEKKQKKIFFPKDSLIFNAFNSLPIEKVKVVIMGQDPYHGINQANGLCFSVSPGIKTPPSLKNIFKELKEDVGFRPPNHGCLQTWANQGVLLLNSVLTVRQAEASSHQGQGWEQFTDAVIRELSQRNKGLVYMLWGAYAHKKGETINPLENLILKSAHPSPLSAYRGFFGCKHFSKCNEYLESQQIDPISWQIEDIESY